MTNEQTAVSDRQRIIEDVAAAIGVRPDELDTETNLLDIGLDSVRIMSLVEKWRAAGHDQIDLPTLAAEPVLGSWLEILA